MSDSIDIFGHVIASSLPKRKVAAHGNRRPRSSKPAPDDVPELDLSVLLERDAGTIVPVRQEQLDMFGHLLPPEVMGDIRIAPRVLSPAEVSELWHRSHRKNLERAELKKPRTEMLALMSEGCFPQNGETFVISRDGELLDGLLRVGAAYAAGVPLAGWFVTGVPSERMHQIDLRTKREASGRPLPMPSWTGMPDVMTAMRAEASRDFGQRPVFQWLTKELAGRLLFATRPRSYLGAKHRTNYGEIELDVSQSLFHLTGQAVVKVDRNGRLLDGRKLCQAVYRTGISVPCLIMWDVDESLAGTYDQGRRHSTANRLFARGYAWGYDDVPAVKSLERIARDDRSWNEPDSRIHAYYAKYKEELSLSLRAARGCKKSLLQGATVPLHYIFSRTDRERADLFFKTLAASLRSFRLGKPIRGHESPVDALVSWLAGTGVLGVPPKERTDETPEIWAIIQAWNASLTGIAPVFEAPHGTGYPAIEA